MKRKLILVVLFLVGIATVKPQTAKAQGFEWGLRDGLSLSWLVGVEDTFPHVGIYVGVAGNYFFNEKWGVGTDITLSEQGALCGVNDDGVLIEYIYDYVNIPIMGQYQIVLDNEQRLRFLAGVQLGLFLLGQYEYEAPSLIGDGVVQGSDFLDRDDFHPWDLGVTLGAQWLIGDWLIGECVSLDVRYTLGVTQSHRGAANTLNGYYYVSVPDNRNSVFQIGTTFFF